MIERFAYVLLIVALVSAGGSAPFAHVHPQSPDHTALQPDTAPQPEEARAHSHSAHRHRHHQGQGAHWHLRGRQAADGPATTLVGNRHHHPTTVAVATVAVERLGVRGGATPALADVWEAGTVPDPPGRPVPVAANARPNPPPRILLAARAPPL